MNVCLAYPVLLASDHRIISDFRRLHDQKYVDVVDIHWTMIFPVSTGDIELNYLKDHIARVAAGFPPINFVCRYALVYKDGAGGDYSIFLVPDEGFSSISLLHDALYSGIMRPHLRLNLPYIPHIGIAANKDKEHLYQLAKGWNSHALEIRGTINSLTLSSYRGEKVEDIKQFLLNKSE